MDIIQYISFLVIAASTAWVAADASGRDFSGSSFADATWKWVVGCLFLWIVIFPMYIVKRNAAPLRANDGRA
jgi:hypothetical protein